MPTFAFGTAVHGSNEPIGWLTALVCDPTTDEITHLVVNADDVPGSERLVPVHHVAEHDAARVTLDLSRHQFFDLPTFETPMFSPASRSVSGSDAAEWHLPFVTSELHGMTFAPHERIPKAEVALRRGTQLVDSDGSRLGRADAFVVDRGGRDITHLVLERTHLFHHEHITVPVSNIDRMTRSDIRLNIDASAVGQLPRVPIRRHR